MIIYKTTNLINGKIYIGQSINNDPKYLGSGVFLKNAIEKHGKENFLKEVIDVADSVDELNEKEIYWIEKYNSTDKNIGYNLCSGGKGFKIYYGKTDEQISEIHENLSKIHKEKWNNILLNMSDDELKKLSESRSEISKKSWDISDDEYKEKCKRISEGIKNSDFDFKSQLKSYWDSLTNEERNKINQKRNLSNSEFWKNMSEDLYKKRCENISNALRNDPNRFERNSKISKSLSEETKIRMYKQISESQINNWKHIKECLKKDKSDLSEEELLVVIKYEKQRNKIIESNKATFEVKNNITGEMFTIVSVDELCKIIGISKFIYKYNISKKNYIINNYEFKKIKK